MKCEAQFISKDNDVSGIGLFKTCAIAEGETKVKVCSVARELEFPANIYSEISKNRFRIKDPELYSLIASDSIEKLAYIVHEAITP